MGCLLNKWQHCNYVNTQQYLTARTFLSQWSPMRKECWHFPSLYWSRFWYIIYLLCQHLFDWWAFFISFPRNHQEHGLCGHQNDRTGSSPIIRKTTFLIEQEIEWQFLKIIPNFQLQLSEVIARSRRYFTEVTGLSADNNILQQNASPAIFEKRFETADILTENPAVKKWLQQMTYDQKG